MSAESQPQSAPQSGKPERRTGVADIGRMHADGQRIAMLTAYDYPTARIVDEAGIPMILVGDSVGMVMLGYEETVRVTMDEMLHHVKAVVRGTRRTLVVADMPFLSYGVTEQASLEHAGRFISEGGAHAVKVEGGVRSARTIETVARSGIPVMGHIGLTPQAVYGLGGHRVQGKTVESARRLLADALGVQESGAFAVVLELVPAELAAAVTERLRIPTIGIGAGAGCSGQVQVITDLLGLTYGFIPRHAKRYEELGLRMSEAVTAYATDVAAGTFPGPEHSSKMDPEVLAEVLGAGALDRADMSKEPIPLDRDL
jgi:3-methyl-2-oxobutanoate hydroxymethyltransferase